MNEILEFESVFTEHISRGHLEQAIDLSLLFFKNLDNDSIYNEFLNLSNRFEHLRNQNRQGIISLSEYDLLRNKIGSSAIELITVYKRNTQRANFRESNTSKNINYTAEEIKFANIKIVKAKSYSKDASILYKKRKINDAITKLELSSEAYKNIFYENVVLQKSASTLYDVISVYFALWALDTKNRQLHSKELLNQLEKFKRHDIDINKSRQEELFKDYEDVNNDIKFLEVIGYITVISLLLGLMSLLIGIFFPNIDFFALLFIISCIVFLLSLLLGGAAHSRIEKTCMKRIL